MLTMAVGIALGAATLVVTNEIVRDKTKDKNPVAITGNPNPAPTVNVEKAFEDYQKAYREYQQAAGLGRADIKKYSDAYKEAKRNLEIAIMRNTPGTSEMNLPVLGGKNPSATSSTSGQSNNGSANPFGVDTVVIGNSASSDSSAGLSDSSAPAASTGFTGEVSGMNYYKVKSGDSLAKICEQFYGASGMWQHILKYQIPSIAATPNLIFPGQLIALPRGIKPANPTATVTKPSTTTPSTQTTPSTGKYTTAPAGNESWQESFQKDYLVSDRTLTDSKSMTVAGIQKFLEARGSVLAKPYNGSTPAQMIYNACQKYGISPKVLLTRLQCEQGLISKKTASQKELDWAVGVGCYDSGNWNQKFKGFDKQIEYCAQTYRRHYDDAKAKLDRGEKISMTIDGKQINVKNAASYSFYKYCPHIQGNKLFFDVWRGYRSKF